MVVCYRCMNNNCEESRDESSFSIWTLFKKYDYQTALTYINTLTDEQLYKLRSGYSFAHTQVYYISSITPNYNEERYNALFILIKLSLLLPKNKFIKLISMGTQTDNKHTALHHLYENCVNPQKNNIKRCTDLFIRFGLKMNQKNSNGLSPNDYLQQKKQYGLFDEKIKKLTFDYKSIENDLKPIILETFYNEFEKCEKCNRIISYISDLEKINKNDFILKMKNNIDNIIKALNLRLQVNEYFKKSCKAEAKVIEAHEHIINIYKNLVN